MREQMFFFQMSHEPSFTVATLLDEQQKSLHLYKTNKVPQNVQILYHATTEYDADPTQIADRSEK